MAFESHSNGQVDNFLKADIKAAGLELINVEKKKTVVLEEEEITYIYTFKKGDSSITANVAVSDPLYFCDVTFKKDENDYFSLKPYLKTLGENTEMEQLFDFYMDEKIDDEQYVLGYLNLFKKYLSESDVQMVLSGEFWPDVPDEE